MNELKGKWIVVEPSTYGMCGIDRLEVLYVVKDQIKQVMACESKDPHYPRVQRIQKSNILGTVSEDKVSIIRGKARDTHKEYADKRKLLFKEYLKKMRSIADAELSETEVNNLSLTST